MSHCRTCEIMLELVRNVRTQEEIIRHILLKKVHTLIGRLRQAHPVGDAGYAHLCQNHSNHGVDHTRNVPNL